MLLASEIIQNKNIYLLYNPTMEQIAIHWTVFIFHGQYWIIIGEYRSILGNNVK